MKDDLKKKIFEQYRDWLVKAGIETTSQDRALCPLCWEEKEYQELSLEHIIPQSVGGNRCVLTCTQCNNEHGSKLDSHISRFQSTQDAFKGHGTIPATLDVKGKKVVANIEWGDGFKNIQIVDKASNPATISGIQDMFKNGEVSEINLNLLYGYAMKSLQEGLLRCAYLAVFKCFGYEYARQKGVQIIRRRICDPLVKCPPLDSLTGILNGDKLSWDKSHIIIPCRIDGYESFFVIIPLRQKTTTYRFVFMPRNNNFDEFLKMTENFKKHNDKNKINISFENAFV